MELNRDKSAAPLYIQIKDILADRIHSGTYQVGSVLPSETELQNEFNVSRVTVRLAVRELTADGMVEPRRGIGTLIKGDKLLAEHINALKSFSDEMRDRNMIPGLSKASFRYEAAGPAIAKIMSIEEKDYVCHLVRIRTGNNIPILYDECYFPGAMKDILQYNYMTTSLYELFRANGITIAHATDTYSADLASSDVAEGLGITTASPVMIRTRIAYDADERVAEYSILTYNAKLYSYSVELRN